MRAIPRMVQPLFLLLLLLLFVLLIKGKRLSLRLDRGLLRLDQILQLRNFGPQGLLLGIPL